MIDRSEASGRSGLELLTSVHLSALSFPVLCLNSNSAEGSVLNASSFVEQGFPRSTVGKESACNAGDLSRFLGREDQLEKG